MNQNEIAKNVRKYPHLQRGERNYALELNCIKKRNEYLKMKFKNKIKELTK
jgi:hypothetical protein